MKRNSQYIVCLVVILLMALPSGAQEKNITVHAKDQKLGELLQEISSTYRLRFAFNADLLAGLTVNLELDSVPVSRFLDEISAKHHLLYEWIDGTCVLYADPSPSPPGRTFLFEGTVSDRETGEPLLFCHILLGKTSGTTTNELGIFSQMMPETDRMSVKISHLGYQQMDTVLSVSPGVFHRIRLRPYSVQMKAIKVYQEQKDMIALNKESERIAFNPAQSANLPRIDDSDLITALSLIPGIQLAGGQTPGISIRGSSPSENLILLDGMPVLETSHLFGNMSVLNAKFISQAFVSRGAFDATYGERVAGMVELTGQYNYFKPALNLSAGLLNVNAAGQIPLGKKVSLSGAYRRSYIDQWQNYLYKQILEQQSLTNEAASVIPGVRFDDFNLKLSIKPSERQEVTLNAFNSNDKQDREFLYTNDRLFRNDQADIKNTGLSANWKYQSQHHWRHSFSAGYNEVSRNSLSYAGLASNKQGKGGKEESDVDNNYLQELRLSWSTELKTGSFTHQLGAGVDFDDVRYHYRFESSSGNTPVDSTQYDRNAALLHAYFQEKISLTDKLSIRAGVRVNREGSSGDFFVQPRFGASLYLMPDLNLFYSGGLYNQFLSQIRKIDAGGVADHVWYLPDPTGEGILNAQQHAWGVRYEKKGLTAEAELFYRRTKDKLNLYGELSGTRDKTVTYTPREGEAENYGADLLVHYRQKYLTHMLAWSVSKGVEQFAGFNEGLSYPAFNDQRHRIRWTEMARYGGWIFSTNLTCNSGSPYPVGGIDGAVQFERLPWFIQADLALIRNFRLKSSVISCGTSLLNLFDRQNVLEVDYFNISDETGSYSFRTDLRAMKFTPVFFLNIRIN